jgi:hypothetical protein
MLIDWHWNHLDARIGESDSRSEVSGIFHPHGLALLEQKACQKIERLLHSGNHNDLVRAASHASR